MATWEELAQEENAGEYKQTGGFAPMPEGTRVLQNLEEIKLDSYKDSSHKNLNIKWRIDGPEDFKGRVYYQTIYINGTDPLSKYYDKDKQEKTIADARKMVIAIDSQASKGLLELILAKTKETGEEYAPTDADYQKYLIAAQMMAVLGVTKTGKQTVRGISGIDPDLLPKKSSTPKSAAKTKPIDNGFDDIDDDIPF